MYFSHQIRILFCKACLQHLGSKPERRFARCRVVTQNDAVALGWIDDHSSELLHRSVTAETIDTSLSVAPRHEWALFNNRDKFDLVAVYDDSSESIDPRSPLAVLVRAIYETAFTKMLKHIPVLLVGGFQAWKREVGDLEVVRGSPDARGSSNVSSLISSVSSLSMNGVNAPISQESKSPSFKNLPSTHSRLPAETFSSTSAAITTDQDGILFGRGRSSTQASVDPNPHKVWHPSHSSSSMSLDYSSNPPRHVTI